MRSSMLARIPGFRQRIIPEPHVPSRGSQARGTRLYIAATSRQYGYQPGVSVVYYSILQNITATSRQYGYQPGVSVVYYSILQNITATSRGYLTVIQYYNAIRVSAKPVSSIL